MWAVAVLVAILALRNIAGENMVPSNLYVPVNLALTAVVAMVAATTRVSAPELGLHGRAR